MEWTVVLSVIIVNVLLSSDNALAIGMACRGLRASQKKRVLYWGSTCAVFLQFVLTCIATFLVSIPYLKLLAGFILAVVAINLFDSDEETVSAQLESLDLLPAILKVMVANAIMSLDNVLAVAVVTEGNYLLLGLGLFVSFPVIICGSTVIAKAIDKYPAVVWLGAMFLGWTAGGIVASDPYVSMILDMCGLDNMEVSLLFMSVVLSAGGLMRRSLDINSGR